MPYAARYAVMSVRKGMIGRYKHTAANSLETMHCGNQGGIAELQVSSLIMGMEPFLCYRKLRFHSIKTLRVDAHSRERNYVAKATAL